MTSNNCTILDKERPFFGDLYRSDCQICLETIREKDGFLAVESFFHGKSWAVKILVFFLGGLDKKRFVPSKMFPKNLGIDGLDHQVTLFIIAHVYSFISEGMIQRVPTIFPIRNLPASCAKRSSLLSGAELRFARQICRSSVLLEWRNMTFMISLAFQAFSSKPKVDFSPNASTVYSLLRRNNNTFLD